MTTTADGPLRVCFVNFFAYPLFNPAAGTSFGGAELQLYTLATELARDPGFAVSFLVLLAVVAISASVLERRVRGVEVVA